MSIRRCALAVALFWSSALLAADPAAVLQQIRSTALDPSQAAEVTGVKLTLGGGGVLELRSGLVVPATPVGDTPVEVVFIGDGAIQLDAPDEIEAAQLELFTGSTALAEDFGEGVFVVGDPAALRTLLEHRSASPPPGKLARAAELYRKWLDGPERKLASTESVLYAYGLNVQDRYFAASMDGRELGQFVYLYDPDADEELTVGQFVPAPVEKREARRIRRRLEREQRRGRHLGVRLEDLGQWDTWVSASIGQAHVPDFEPARYVIDIDVADRSLHATGKARIDLTAPAGARQLVRLQLHPDLAVQRVLAGTTVIPHFRSGSDLSVHLPARPAANETVSITVDYAGELLQKVARKTVVLRDTLWWYPRAGMLDRATYDVTFRWPRSLLLVSSGKRVDGGMTGDRRWERRTLDRPSFDFSFELGDFVQEAFDAGHVKVTLAWDPEARGLDRDTKDEIRKTVQDALLYFEETYGRYPLDELTVVTVMRDSSQSHFGFITLSNLMMGEWEAFALAFGIQDRRTVIAHEIAHQWWGHIVGWSSYRDQWFTEALANYSALRFARKKLADSGRSRLGPTAGWQAQILDTTEDGRTLESLGPLTLGSRLNSTRSEHAYESIIYKKGALVFAMLARNYGEDAFDEVLRHVVTTANNRQITTRDLLQIVSSVTRAKEVDVEEFAKQFIYGTGVPVVLFDYRFVPSGPMAWTVKGSATQYSTVRYRYRIVPVESRYGVAREAIPESKIAQWAMVVPFQLGIERPRRPLDPEPADTELAKEIGNAFIFGRFWIRGRETTSFEFQVQYPPKMFWLDRDKETLAIFYSPRTNPKRVLIGEAMTRAGEGRFAEAEQKFREALQAPATTEFDPDDYRWWGQELRKAYLEAQDEVFDAVAHLGLARIRLDQKQYASVRSELQQARKGTGRYSAIRSEAGILEARLLIEEGDYENGFNRLRKLLLGRSAIASDAEGYAWLAIAARLTKHPKELEKALEAAQRKGVDTAALK